MKTERVKTAIGDLSGVMALFAKAKGHLKAPAIVLQVGEMELRLSIAGPAARAPGTVNVATNEGFQHSRWFGRILLDGQFEASPREPTPPGLIEGLQRFACDPAGVAAEHGRLSGKCCWCNQRLTDERSTSVGYGKRCSEVWGMPYPSIKKVRAAKGADLFANG